jgi:hypothetical protein
MSRKRGHVRGHQPQAGVSRQEFVDLFFKSSRR